MKNQEYYKIDLNSEYIVNFLQKENLSDDRYEEIDFRISKLNYYQFFNVFNNIIPSLFFEDGSNANGTNLSKTNLQLFFEFNDYGDFPFPCVSNVSLRCKNLHPQIVKGKRTKVNHNTIIIDEIKSILNNLDSYDNFQNKNVSNETITALLESSKGPSEFTYVELIKQTLRQMLNWGNHLMYGNEYKSGRKFNIECDIHLLKNLYRNLEREEFLLQNNTTLNDFLYVFLYNWDEHTSVIHLNMSHPQTYLFFKELERQSNIKIPFSEIELSKKIRNNSGIIKAASLSASTKRNAKIAVLPNKGDLIKEIISSSIK